MRIGELLVRLGRLDAAQVQAAVAHQRQWGGRIGASIVSLGFLPEPAILEAVAQQLGVPFVVLAGRRIPPNVLALVPRRIAELRRVLPVALEAGPYRGVLVALADPSDLGVIDELAFATGLAVRPALAGEEDLDRALEQHLGIAPRPRAQRGFASRTDAIDLAPVGARGKGGGRAN